MGNDRVYGDGCGLQKDLEQDLKKFAWECWCRKHWRTVIIKRHCMERGEESQGGKLMKHRNDNYIIWW